MKAINDEARKAQVGKYLRAEHFTRNGGLSLYLVKVNQVEKESARTGNSYSQNEYMFLDQDREERIFSSFLDDAFWHAFEKADPEVGQLMHIEAEEIAQNTYTWTITLDKEIIDVWGDQEQTGADAEVTEAQRAGRQVVEDGKNRSKDEDEIKLEDIPFI